MSRVLLTGASGLIGSEAVRALLAGGHDVHALARAAGPPQEGVTWHALDLLAAGSGGAAVAAAEPELLLHLAWYATPGKFWTAPENELWVAASLDLLRAFGEAGGRRAVMAGTCAEYRWGAPRLIESTTPLDPATLYGSSKHATHEAATELAQQLGVSFAWGRVFFLYGAGEDPLRLVAGVASSLLAGDQVPTTSGVQRRDFMHVEDVAGAFAALLDSDVCGPVNVASGRAVAVREIVELIGRAAGASERLRIGALAQRDGEPDVIEGDVARLTREVGFRPRIDLEPGIVKVVGELREALEQGDPSRAT